MPRNGVEDFCDGWQKCRSMFNPSSRGCLVCFAIGTLIKEGRQDEANEATMAWALDFEFAADSRAV